MYIDLVVECRHPQPSLISLELRTLGTLSADALRRFFFFDSLKGQISNFSVFLFCSLLKSHPFPMFSHVFMLSFDTLLYSFAMREVHCGRVYVCRWLDWTLSVCDGQGPSRMNLANSTKKTVGFNGCLGDYMPPTTF